MEGEAVSAQSVVDYAAWNKGYMPPSEHILIHKLSHEGARVVLSTWLGGKAQLWVVIEGEYPLTNKQRKLLREMMAMWFEDEPEQIAKVTEPKPQEVTDPVISAGAP